MIDETTTLTAKEHFQGSLLEFKKAIRFFNKKKNRPPAWKLLEQDFQNIINCYLQELDKEKRTNVEPA